MGVEELVGVSVLNHSDTGGTELHREIFSVELRAPLCLCGEACWVNKGRNSSYFSKPSTSTMDLNPIVLSVPLFFVLIGVELLIERFTKQKLYRLEDSIANISCGITQQLTGLF